MSGRVQPILLVLLLVVGLAAAWFLFLREDVGGTEGDLQGDASEQGGVSGGTDLMRAGHVRGVVAELFYAAHEESYRAWLQVRVDPTRLPGGKGGLPAVYEVELRYTDFEPPLTDIEPTGLLQSGWNERGIEGGHRFFTISDPLPMDGRYAKWQFGFRTVAEGGPGPRLEKGRLRLLSREGELIGTADLTLK